MADVVIGAIVFLAVITTVWVAVRAYNGSHSTNHEALWTTDERRERNDNGQLVVSVYCTRLGNQDLLVGAAIWGHPDFESEIEGIRSQAEYRLAALNRPLRLVR